MKELITAMASMIIVMIFVLQFTANQSTYLKMAGAEHIIKQHRIEAEENCDAGIFKHDELKRKIAEKTGCEASEISVCLNESRNDETAVTYEYRIVIPIHDVIGADRIMGISADKNVVNYTSEGVLHISKRSDESDAENNPAPEENDENSENEKKD